MSIVVFVAHEGADRRLSDAFAKLGQLTTEGLTDEFILVRPSGVDHPRVDAIRFAAGEPPENVHLLSVLVQRSSIDIFRLVTVATAAVSPAETNELVASVVRLKERLLENHPAGVPFVDARVLFPDRVDEATHASAIFHAAAAANLVVMPEDRRSDAGYAAPVDSNSDDFGGHIAVEMATQAGLWAGMREAPIDAGQSGVVDNGDAAVRFVRSYARLAVAPPLPVQDAVALAEVLPVPTGLEAAPIPRQAAVRFSQSFFESAPLLHFEEAPPAPDGRHKMGIAETAKLIAREAGYFIRTIPQQVKNGALQDLSTTAGETLTASLGESSVIEVVWAGKVADGEGDASGVDPEAVRAAAQQRMESPEAASLDQQIWSRLVDDVLGSSDGGPLSADVEAPHVGTARVTILDPRAIAAGPPSDLGSLLDQVNSEPLTCEDPTLLGHLSAQVRDEIDRADQGFLHLISVIERAGEELRPRKYPLAGILSWLLAVCLTGFLSSVIIFSRLGDNLGLATDSASARTRVAAASTVLILGALAVLLIAGLRGVPWLQKALLGYGGGALAGLGLSAAYWSVQFEFDLIQSEARVGEIILASTIVSAFVTVFVLLIPQRTHRAQAALRLAGMLALVCAAAILLVILYQPAGWVETVAPAVFRSLAVRWLGGLSLVMLGLLSVIAALRVRANLKIEEAQRRLRWAAGGCEHVAAEQARLRHVIRQFHGTVASIARTVWLPFGKNDTGRQYVTTDVGTGLGVQKFRVMHHKPTTLDMRAIVAKIRDEISDRGWLLRQYGAAVSAFQPEYAYRTGRDLAALGTRRPEADPFPEDPRLGPTEPGEGVRWRFASMLYEGEFDRSLRAIGNSVALEAVLEQYLGQAPGVASANSDIQSFSREIIEGEPPNLPLSLFGKSSIPVASDSRWKYRTTVHWPAALNMYETPSGAQVVPSDVMTETPIGLVVSFVRSDWSEPFARRALPLYFEASSLVVSFAEPVVQPQDQDEDVM
jgi:hypothetical protein